MVKAVSIRNADTIFSEWNFRQVIVMETNIKKIPAGGDPRLM